MARGLRATFAGVKQLFPAPLLCTLTSPDHHVCLPVALGYHLDRCAPCHGPLAKLELIVGHRIRRRYRDLVHQGKLCPLASLSHPPDPSRDPPGPPRRLKDPRRRRRPAHPRRRRQPLDRVGPEIHRQCLHGQGARWPGQGVRDVPGGVRQPGRRCRVHWHSAHVPLREHEGCAECRQARLVREGVLC